MKGACLVTTKTIWKIYKNFIFTLKNNFFFKYLVIVGTKMRTGNKPRNQKVRTRNEPMHQKVRSQNKPRHQKMQTRNKPRHQKMRTRNKPQYQNLVACKKFSGGEMVLGERYWWNCVGRAVLEELLCLHCFHIRVGNTESGFHF